MWNLSPQVHLLMTYHPRCWEDMLSRCILDAERLGQVRSGAHHFSAASVFFYLNGPLAQLVRALGS